MFRIELIFLLGYPYIKGGIQMKKKQVGIKKDYSKQYQELSKDIRGMPRDQKLEYLQSFYKQVAKVADQRLVNLERLSKNKDYRDVLQWAYKDAMYDIHAAYGEKAKRFNRKQPDDLRTLQKNLRRVLSFLEKPSSSRQGIDEVYQKRAQTVSDKYGVNVTWQNIGDLYMSTLYRKTDSKKGSKTVLKAIGRIQANAKEIKKALKDQKAIQYHVAQDDIEDVMNNLLRYYKKDVSKLLKKI